MKEKPVVYFAKVQNDDKEPSIEKKICELFDRAGFSGFVNEGDLVAVKTHFGEEGNRTHIRANHIRQIVDKIKGRGGKPYLTETSVLYKSRRSNALDHILLAFEHGFTYERVGAPIIMADGFLGNWDREIPIGGECYERVFVAGDSLAPDKLFVVSHATGHPLSGYGAAFKNMGMGLSSRKGKLEQHSQVAPSVRPNVCTFCQVCMKWCPENAIIEKDKKAFIVKEKCIGCGECLAVCRYDAIKFKWTSTSEILQKKMVEHAYAIFIEKRERIAFINFLISMTKNCDCMPTEGTFMDDIGILASFDPVAIDKATLDLTEKLHGENISRMAFPEHDPMIQINHAVKLKMGSADYTIVEL